MKIIIDSKNYSQKATLVENSIEMSPQPYYLIIVSNRNYVFNVILNLLIINKLKRVI